MRARLSELGLPVPDWARVETPAELDDFIADHGGVAVVKTPRGGYDGKGVRVVRDAREAADWLAHGPLLAEELVAFRRELAQLVARRPSGDVVAWPLVETLQREGVCAEVIAPAPGAGDLGRQASELAARIAGALEVSGVLAVELFETQQGQLLVNELAMRPHNTGHWSIDGAITSQFEQHLRAVLDLPLGDPAPRAEWSVMVNVIGGPDGAALPDRYPVAMAAEPAVKFHSYGKQSRPGRKVGHVTSTGGDLDEALRSARAAAAFVHS
jgi:5-(carboxyamino)imidazole ribonucleotide synthase